MDNYKIMGKEEFETLYLTESDPWSTGDATGIYCFDEILEMLQPYTPTDTIFDVGCGLGAFTNRLSKLAKRTVGFDISSTAVEKAKNRFPHLEFKCFDLAREMPNEQADIVIANEVLYYQDPLRRITFLENVYKISKEYVLFGYYILNERDDLMCRWINMYFEVIREVDRGHILLLTKKRRK